MPDFKFPMQSAKRRRGREVDARERESSRSLARERSRLLLYFKIHRMRAVLHLIIRRGALKRARKSESIAHRPRATEIPVGEWPIPLYGKASALCSPSSPRMYPFKQFPFTSRRTDRRANSCGVSRIGCCTGAPLSLSLSRTRSLSYYATRVCNLIEYSVIRSRNYLSAHGRFIPQGMCVCVYMCGRIEFP